MPHQAKHPLTVSKRMTAYRNRLRKAGLKPMQIWVPDPAAPGFADKCRAQALSIARHDPAGADAQRFIEATYEWPEA